MHWVQGRLCSLWEANLGYADADRQHVCACVPQGKLQGRLLEFAMPQPVDECLAIMGDLLTTQAERESAVVGVYARAIKDGDVRTPPAGLLHGGCRSF